MTTKDQYFEPSIPVESRPTPFQPKELMNGYEHGLLELITTIDFGREMLCWNEAPLKRICERFKFITTEIWHNWKDSTVDVAVIDPNLGTYCRKACLVIEGQSSYHDADDAKKRDAQKAEILAWAGIPLIYARFVDYPRVLRFYTPDETEEIYYHLFNQRGREELEVFLKYHCL